MGWFSDATAVVEGSTPAGIASSTAEKVVAGVFDGISDIIKDFKLPPEQQLIFDAKMADLAVQAKKDASSDRNSARQREMTLKDSTPKILAFSVVGGFLTMTTGLIVTALCGVKIDPVASGLLGTLVGYLSAKSELILAYYFGSSAGSDKKTDLLNQR